MNIQRGLESQGLYYRVVCNIGNVGTLVSLGARVNGIALIFKRMPQHSTEQVNDLRNFTTLLHCPLGGWGTLVCR